jgi:hypothetical protein
MLAMVARSGTLKLESPEHLRDRKDQVGGRGAFLEAAVKPEAEDFRDEHGGWLA